MNLAIGYIPYLNMLPFHQGFGPEPLQEGGHTLQFKPLSPRALGLEADAGRIDAGAISLVDTFHLAGRYEPLGDFGVGVKQAAESVLLFSKRPIAEMKGLCAVTDETSTSVRLLQVLLENRYQRNAVTLGRVASGALYDGSAEALLLIGDEALRAREQGIKELPWVTDLATEWFTWQNTPFVFARWMARRELPLPVKEILARKLEYSLKATLLNPAELAFKESEKRAMAAAAITAYWDKFCYEITSEHMKAIEQFQSLLNQTSKESECLTV